MFNSTFLTSWSNSNNPGVIRLMQYKSMNFNCITELPNNLGSPYFVDNNFINTSEHWFDWVSHCCCIWSRDDKIKNFDLTKDDSIEKRAIKRPEVLIELLLSTKYTSNNTRKWRKYHSGNKERREINMFKLNFIMLEVLNRDKPDKNKISTVQQLYAAFGN